MNGALWAMIWVLQLLPKLMPAQPYLFERTYGFFALNFSDHNYWHHVPPPTLRPRNNKMHVGLVTTINVTSCLYKYTHKNPVPAVHTLKTCDRACLKKGCYRGGCSTRHERYCLPPHMEIIFQFWQKKIIIISKLLVCWSSVWCIDRASFPNAIIPANNSDSVL